MDAEAIAKLPGEIEWLEAEFFSLSFATQNEFCCTDEGSAEYASDRDRAKAIFDAIRAILKGES